MARFFNTDLHISVVADLQHIFRELGHTIDDWCMSGHHWVLGKERRASPVLHWNNWRELNDDLCASFYATHREELAKFDGFVVTHCPPFALLFRRWEKPVIVVVSTRYNNGFEGRPSQLQWIENGLREMLDCGQARIVANNRYDAWHFAQGLGLPRPLPVIECLCEYTGMHWSPTTENVLFDRGRFPPMEPPVGTVAQTSRDWQVLARCRALVHSPYNISTMSYFEQYTAGIPLVFPSLRLLASDPRFLTELGIPAGDPGLADFYHWPAITLFESFEEISQHLGGIDVAGINAAMMQHNVFRRQAVYVSWSNIIRSL